LVFSTLHTNDAAGALTRLVDMGVEPFLISSSVEAVLAQRLVRSICPHCKEGYKPDLKLLASLGLDRFFQGQAESSGKETLFYRGKGCKECNQIGYRGRRGVYEMLVLEESIRRMILEGRPATEIKKVARENTGMTTLREDGLVKVLRGDTTLDEVMRITMEDAD
jgi:type II secretory ATPase GspE/PulE/Tfp pilus assembly ATPase PilB-like protein